MAINLQKNQGINLVKADQSPLNSLHVGLGWDAKKVTKRGLFGGTKTVEKSIDLDAWAFLLSGSQVVDKVWYDHLRSNDGSVVHSGDNLTGQGDGDDEVITVNLNALPAQVDRVVFVVHSYSRQSFGEVENAFARAVDAQTGTEMARYSLSDMGNCQGVVMAKAVRGPQGWRYEAVGAPTNENSKDGLAQAALSA